MMKINTARLNLAQARAKMSSKELQKKANISDVTLGRIRNGMQESRPQTVGRIAAALGVDVSEIIEV